MTFRGLVSLCAAALAVTLALVGAGAAGASLGQPGLSATHVATCDGTTTVTVSFHAQNPPPVEQAADIELVVDESGSITAANFAAIKQALVAFANNADVSADGNHIGLVQFADVGAERLLAERRPGVGSERALDDLPARRQHEHDVRSHGRAERAGRLRPGKPKVVIVVTDGVWNYLPAPGQVVDQLAASGVRLFAVGVGSGIDQDALLLLAGGNAAHVFPLANYVGLQDALGDALLQAVPAATSAAYSATVAPGWEVTGATASAGTVGSTATGVSWSAATIDAPGGADVTISYTLRHTGTENGPTPLHASAALTWSDQGVAQSQDFSGASVDVTGCNRAPVASAGADRAAQLSGAHTASVTLDGSGSTDDGKPGPLTYAWAEGSTQLGTGSTCAPISGPAYTFGAGTSTFSATATDLAANTAAASTQFTVAVAQAGICGLATSFVQGSAKYQSLKAAQRKGVDVSAKPACAVLDLVVPKLSGVLERAYLGSYELALKGLVHAGWLTQGQATTLVDLSKSL
jgi:hypothetical protein